MLAQDPSPILRRCQTLPVDKWASQSLLCAGMVSPTVCVTLALLASTHAAVLEVGKQRIGRKTHERQYASTSSVQRQRHAKQFVYVYDMPAKFTTDIARLSPEWHSEQYDYDQVRHCARTEQFPISAPVSMQARDVARSSRQPSEDRKQHLQHKRTRKASQRTDAATRHWWHGLVGHCDMHSTSICMTPIWSCRCCMSTSKAALRGQRILNRRSSS